MITSTHLLYFLAVVEHRRFRRAAEALHISQPALTKSIQRLEDLLGAKLFVRSRQGLTITPAGEILVIHAKLATSQLKRAHEEIAELQHAAIGQIVVGAGPAVQDEVLPLALSALWAKRPNVRIRVVVGYNDVLLPALRRGDLDIVVGGLTPDIRDPALSHEVLYHDRLAIAARSSHPIVRLKAPSLERLRTESWILGPETGYARQWFDAVFRSREVACVTPILEVNSFAFVKSILLSRDILAFIPQQAYRDEERRGLVATIRVDELMMGRSVAISHRRDSHLPASVGFLIDELKSICKAMRYSEEADAGGSGQPGSENRPR